MMLTAALLLLTAVLVPINLKASLHGEGFAEKKQHLLGRDHNPIVATNYGVAVVNEDEQAFLFPPISLISQAFADDTQTCFSDSITITALTVATDGTIEPQAIGNVGEDSELKIAYYDLTTCEFGEEAELKPIESLLFVAQSAAGVSADSGSVYQASSDGTVVKIAKDSDEGKFVVQSGDFDTNYLMASFGSSVSAMAVNTSKEDFLALSPSPLEGEGGGTPGEGVIAAYDLADGTFTGVTDSSAICAATDKCSPVGMKQKGSKSYFITKYDSSVDAVSDGYIHELYDNSDERIKFITDGLVNNEPITFRKGLAFDVVEDGSSYNDVLVAFEDGDGATRFLGLFGKDRKSIYPAVTETLSSLSDIQDIVIYTPQSSDDSSNGSALLTTDSGVYFIDYDFINTVCEEEDCMDDGTTLSVDTTNPISIANLKTVVVNDDNTFAYALADDTIHVIDLSSKATSKTITLSTVIGKDITFGASAMLFTTLGEKNFLVVSVDDLKSAIVVDLSEDYSS